MTLSGAVSKLTPQDQRELQQFVQNESQKGQIQSSMSTVEHDLHRNTSVLFFGRSVTDIRLPAVHELTERCFKRCITGSISGGKLTGKEEGCMQNCVERFMDTNLAVLKHLETLRGAQ